MSGQSGTAAYLCCGHVRTVRRGITQSIKKKSQIPGQGEMFCLEFNLKENTPCLLKLRGLLATVCERLDWNSRKRSYSRWVCSLVLVLRWYVYMHVLKPVPLSSGHMIVRLGMEHLAPAQTLDRRTETTRRLLVQAHITEGICHHTRGVVGCPLRRSLPECPGCNRGLLLSRTRDHSALVASWRGRDLV